MNKIGVKNSKRGIKMKTRIIDFLLLSFSGLFASFFFFHVQSFGLKIIQEFQILQFENISYYGFFIGAALFVISIILKKINIDNNAKIKTLTLFTLMFVGLITTQYYVGDNTILSGIVLTFVFAIGIYLGSDIFSRNNKPSKKYLKNVIGASIGGTLAGFVISLVYVMNIDFAIDEGFFFLVIFSLAFFGFLIGGFIFTIISIWNIIFKNKIEMFSKNLHLYSSHKIIVLIFLSIILFSITAFKYWDTMSLNDEPMLYSLDNESGFSECIDILVEDEIRPFQYNKNQLIDFLKSKPEQSIDILFQLFYLTNDEQYSINFKETLLQDIKNNKFLGISNSVKAWQYKVMHYAYYYDLMLEKNPMLFSPSEEEIILNWFKELNDQTYEITWVSFAYGFINKKLPEGPYENQEIGMGVLSILSKVLEERYPELAKRNQDYIEKYGIGWKHNFRNPDDQIVYAQQAWQKNAFMMANYGGYEDSLRSGNSKNSFEWVLLQWPSNGMSPAYNVPRDWTPFDTMMLGSYLHNDGRYLWISEKMLENEIINDKREIDFILGLEYFENFPNVEKPKIGSCYIEGTTGIGLNPKDLKPDKVVLRDGWDKDSLFALLNLRFSGWHSYKATNSFISIMYGEPFVLEKLDLERHDWLPKGKADHRDKKIERTHLNGFILQSKGLEKIIFDITGYGSMWHQDPPRFAEKSFFKSTAMADFIKTSIFDWHGWDHNRISILVKEDYLVIIDNAEGEDARTVGLSWNMKGDSDFLTNYVKLTQKPYEMNVYYPHSEKYFIEKTSDSKKYPPAGNIHAPDFTLFLIDEDSTKFGASTVFIPQKGEEKQILKINTTKISGEEAFPDAFGIKILKADSLDIVGASFNSETYSYENIKTDADVFLTRITPDTINISFVNAKMFEIDSNNQPKFIEINEKKLVNNVDWVFEENKISIENINEDGNIKIIFK